MSLKIDRVGVNLTNYTYSVAVSNNGTVLVTILYQRTNNNNSHVTKTRVYELYTDTRHSTTRAIITLVNNAFATAQNHVLKIKTFRIRSYVYFDCCGISNQFTGDYH